MHTWSTTATATGLSFINVLLELGADHPVGRAASPISTTFDQIVRERAVAAGLIDVEDFAWSWHILMRGTIILAEAGDPDAALRAKAMAVGLIEQHRPQDSREVGEAVG